MDERPELVRLSQGRGAGARLLGVAAAALIGAAIVAAGALGDGEREEPGPRPVATVHVSAAPDTTHAAAATGLATVALPLQGYAVTYDGTHMLYDDDALAVYQLGDAAVSVAVGTPAEGASLLGEGISERIYGRTLDRLTEAYLAAIGTGAESSAAIEVNGKQGLLLRLTPGVGPGFGPAPAAALFLVDRRAFVFWSHAETALRAFLGGLTFGPGLFVSRDLGFQVPLLVEEQPFGATASSGEGSSGLWVFSDGDRLTDGEYSHVIGVSVGTEAQPAFVRNVPSALPHPSQRRIWAPTLGELVRAYRRLVDPGEGLVAPTILGGGPATLVIRADGLAATVLAVHDGRAYIISTTGANAVERAPHFEEFLANFAFLE